MRESFARHRRSLSFSVVALALWALAGTAFSSELDYERVIDLQGTSNTRDIGGYAIDGLGVIRPGQIIRSENLSRLSAGDFEKLEAIGVKTVIDLRTDAEHREAPTVWQGDHPPRFHHFPVGDTRNDWFRAQHRMLKRNRFTEDQSLEHMIAGYHMIADEGPDSYRKLMEVVADPSNWPILIHCNAGKDRAGIATTLILEALGADRESIMEEFLLTNEIGRSAAKAEFLAKKSSGAGIGSKIGRGPSAGAWYPIVGVMPEMLEAFYAKVEEEYGSMDAFLAELGVDRAARDALAASLVLPEPQLALAD